MPRKPGKRNPRRTTYMKVGECGCTRKGVKYCMTPKGVRFKGKC